MNTSDLIRLLVQDSAKRIGLDKLFFDAVAAAFIIVTVFFFMFIGPRADIEQAVGSGRFLFKFAITVTLTASAGLVLWRMARPGMLKRRHVLGLGVPVVLAIGAAVVEMLVMPSGTWEMRMVGKNSRLCLTIIPALSIVPLAIFLFAMRHGAPENPSFAGAVAGLAAAGLSATFYAANCDDDSPLFVLLWYPIAIAIVATVGALIGNKVLRW
jgi:hypothetical protein